MADIDELRTAFFEDLAQARDRAGQMAREAMAGDAPLWADRPADYKRLRACLITDDDVAAFADAVQECVQVAIHSALVAIDGGSASAEVGVVQLVDAEGRSLGEGLHELWVDHLFDTGRMD